MDKKDCRVGMIVQFGQDMCRGVVIKINRSRAVVSALDAHKRAPPGTTWLVYLTKMHPVVGGDELVNEMFMRSFAEPESKAIKAWSRAQQANKELAGRLSLEDSHIMRAIYEIYMRLEKVDGRARIEPSDKINTLFRALGRSVTMEESNLWAAR